MPQPQMPAYSTAPMRCPIAISILISVKSKQRMLYKSMKYFQKSKTTKKFEKIRSLSTYSGDTSKKEFNLSLTRLDGIARRQCYGLINYKTLKPGENCNVR
jgi:hypothetical protein